jgi:hypothetical protein
MRNLNRFIKGIKYYKDYSLYQNDEWTFPTSGIRISNFDNKGLAITFVNGNININSGNYKGASFIISPGFRPIGVKEESGILFIISFNVTTNEGEIGTYPSPKEVSINNYFGFERIYNPLKNFIVNSNNTNFRTTLFNFTLYNPVDVVIKKIYDNSFNIYLADYRNPNRVINSGFNELGVYVGKTYSEKDFDGSINLILTSSTPIYGKLIDVNYNGNLRIGMYHIFYRYATSTFDRTSFIGITNPIQVAKGSNWDNIEGDFEFDSSGNNIITNKNIIIDFVDDDGNPYEFNKGYEFIEIAYIRYSEDTKGTPIEDVFLIDKKYSITELESQNPPRINISGNENESQLIKEELFKRYSKYTISKSQAIVNSRYFGAKWKKKSYDKKSLMQYASLINVSAGCSHVIDDNELFNPNGIMSGNIYQHKGFNITHNHTGYFKGELYPFAIKGIMSDGSETEAFPIKGSFDRFNLKESPNEKGLYNFPFRSGAAGTECFDSHHQSMFVKFIFDDAYQFYNDNKELFGDIKYIVILRGERRVNLLYQGIAARLIDQLSWKMDNSGNEPHDPHDYIQLSRPPLWMNPFNTANYDSETQYPIVAVCGDESDNGYEKWYTGKSYDNRYKNDRFAILAPDYLFEDGKVSNGMEVEILFYKKYSSTDPYNKGGLTLSGDDKAYKLTGIEYDNPLLTNQTTEILPTAIKVKGKIYFTTQGDSEGNNGFTTHTNLGITSGSNYMFRTSVNADTCPEWVPFDSNFPPKFTVNLGYSVSRYIGVILDQGESLPLHADEYLVNVYLKSPDLTTYENIVNGFNPATEKYFEISPSIKIDTLQTNSDFNKGDCFLQRVYFRAQYAADPGGLYSSYDSGSDNIYANYGVVVSMMAECEFNAAMRGEVWVDNEDLQITYSYFPKINSKNITAKSWASGWKDEKSLYESFFINQGFNKILSDIAVYGYDYTMPNVEYEKRTRIYFSKKSISGEISDGFRLIGSLSFQDYSLENGGITGIFELYGQLISVQSNSVNIHFLGDKQLESSSSSRIVLDETGVYLSDEVKKLSSHGSSYKSSLIISGGNLFGVDFNDKVIWMAGQTGGGFGVIDLTTSKEIKGWIENLYRSYSKFSDKISFLKDLPLLGEGVISGTNNKYNEINFTFHLPILESLTIDVDEIYNINSSYFKYHVLKHNGVLYTALQDVPPGHPPDPCVIVVNPYWKCIYPENAIPFGLYLFIKEFDIVEVEHFNGEGVFYVSPVDRPSSLEMLIPTNGSVNYFNYTKVFDRSLSTTIVFDKDMQYFTGEQPYLPVIYADLNDDLYTVPFSSDIDLEGSFFLHDIESSDVGNFYGDKYPGKLSFIVLGADAREMVKMFNSYIIESNSNEFMKMEFQTDYQDSAIDPFIPSDPNKFYMKPEYIENMWQGPISINDVENALYGVNSEMRGTWLKVTITYNGDDEQFIRKFITDFIISFS